MVTPLGNDPASTWESLVAGESGAGPITHFDTSDYDVHFACELKDFEPTDWIDRKKARRMDRFSQLALSAARMAEADSGISIADEPERVGAAVATGIGGLYAFEDCFQNLLERGPDRTSPFAIVQIIPNMAAAWVSMELGAQGPLAAECTACAASNMAIGDGLDAIRLGRADVMLCGGTEAPITRVGIAGFTAMRALSRRNDDPKAASRPFDSGRDGFVMGEAAAMLVLEELEHARSRGAKIYAEVLGYGVSSDASHVSDPDPSGANPGTGDEDGVHGRGHRSRGDRLRERTRHLDAVGRRRRRRASSSSRSARRRRRVRRCRPRRARRDTASARRARSRRSSAPSRSSRGCFRRRSTTRHPDPECDLDYIPNEARRQDIEVAVNNSFGFGGHNACVVFRRWNEAA